MKSIKKYKHVTKIKYKFDGNLSVFINDKHIMFYSNGLIFSTCDYKPNWHGKKHGIEKSYYNCQDTEPDKIHGTLGYECDYVNGKRHGLCKVYFEDGNIQYVHPYDNGEICGLSGLCRGI